MYFAENLNRANQWTTFYIIVTSVIYSKYIIHSVYLPCHSLFFFSHFCDFFFFHSCFFSLILFVSFFFLLFFFFFFCSNQFLIASFFLLSLTLSLFLGLAFIAVFTFFCFCFFFYFQWFYCVTTNQRKMIKNVCICRLQLNKP